MMFSQQISGPVFVFVGTNGFTNHLLSGLRHVAGLDPLVIVDTGATEIHRVVPTVLLGDVLVPLQQCFNGDLNCRCHFNQPGYYSSIGNRMEECEGKGKHRVKAVVPEGLKVTNTETP